MMKPFTQLLLLILFSISATAQNPCFFPGDPDRWDARFAEPGIPGGTVNALLESNIGGLIIGASAGGGMGGDPNTTTIARFDGEKYEELAGGLYGVSLVPVAYAVAEMPNGDIYVGGNITGGRNRDGSNVPSRNIIKWLAGTNEWEAVDEGVDGLVRALAIDNDTLYAGGSFDNVEGTNGFPVNGVARFYIGSGQWDSLGSGVQFGTGLAATVRAVEVGNNGEVFVGGGISIAGGQSAFSIARWTPGNGWDDIDGGLPATNLSNGQTSPSNVSSLEFDPNTGKMYAGGTFGQFIGSSSVGQVRSLAVWENGVGWTLISGIGISFDVRALRLSGNGQNLYVGGNFQQYNATVAINNPQGNSIMAYDLANATWDNLDGGLEYNAGSPSVQAIAELNGELYVAGSIGSQLVDGRRPNNFLRYDGTEWQLIGEGIGTGTVYDFARDGNDLIIGGNFGSIGGEDIQALARWNPTNGYTPVVSGLANSFGNPSGASVYAVEKVGFDLYIGGIFGQINSIATNGLARYNLVTQTYTTWGTGLGSTSSSRVLDFEVFQGVVYAAGNFTSIDGTPITRLARLTSSGWEAVGDIPSDVRRLYNSADTALFVVGNFSSIDGNTDLARVARYDGTNWHALGQGVPSFSGSARAIAVDPTDGSIWLGGSMSKVRNGDGSDVTVRGVARWDGTQWNMPMGFPLNNSFQEVLAMTFGPDTTLYLGGELDIANTDTIYHLLRYKNNFGLSGMGGGMNNNSPVLDGPNLERIAIIDSFMYVFGDHYRTGNKQSSGIGRYLIDDPGNFAITVDLGMDQTACGSLTLDAGNPGASFFWSTGDTTQTLNVTQSGLYSVTVLGANGCSDVDDVQINIVQADPVFAVDSLDGCDSVLVDAGPGYTEYDWSNGEIGQSVNVDQSDWLIITATDTNGCVIVDSVFVNVDESPTAAFSAQNDGDSTNFNADDSQNATSFEWDFGDGTTASGELVSHVYTSNDSFVVTLIVSNECGADTLQDTVVVDYVVGIEALLGLEELKVFPNPTKGQITLQLQLSMMQSLDLLLYDVQGKKQLYIPLLNQIGLVQKDLDLSVLPKGMYVLVLQGENGRVHKQIVIQ
ncbi:MAG: PKD domain-containing protein [Bacteroidota bacterium]